MLSSATRPSGTYSGYELCEPRALCGQAVVDYKVLDQIEAQSWPPSMALDKDIV